ncbi:MAG: ribonuclease J [Patescibacteria group bacterium]|nr:ribonuclease J [Patescibacteria group bacterium]
MEKENQKRNSSNQQISSSQAVGASRQQKNRGRYGRQVSRGSDRPVQTNQPNLALPANQPLMMTAYHSHGPKRIVLKQDAPKQSNPRSGGRGKRDRGRRGPLELVKSRHNISTRSDYVGAKVFSPQRAKLKMISLGGMGIMNKNLMVYEYEDPNLPDGGDIIIIDCGMGFPDAEMYGIDYLIPDVSYLKDRIKKIRGILITHGHEDHIGALPHILPELGMVPIFATKLTAGLIERKFSEYNLLRSFKVSVFEPEETLRLGVFRIEPFRMAHSVPQNVGYGIHTPYGLVLHVADFKIDLTPADNWATDTEKIKDLCNKAGGALLLGLDSTRIDEKGFSISSKDIDEGFNEAFSTAHGRIIIAAFSSQIARMQQIFEYAQKYGRKVAIAGRSMQNNVDVAFNMGFLKAPPDLIVNLRELNKYKDENLVIIGTGSQAQNRSALMRMSIGEHNQVELKTSDTVIVSASPIPGNEDSVYRMLDDLMRLGPRVIYNKIMQVHATGHGFYGEIEQIFNLVRPKYFAPIHGDFHHLVENRDMALKNGLRSDHIFLFEDGEVLEIDENGARMANYRVPVGSLMVDGLGVGDIGNIVLRDRQAMAQEGLFMVIVTVDRNTGNPLTSPDIISRGFVYMRESNELINGARNEVKKVLANFQQVWTPEWKKEIKEVLKEHIGDYLYKNTKRRPMVIPVVIEV